MGEKKLYQSLTVLGLALMAFIGVLEESGLIPAGTPQALGDLGQAVLGLVALYGRWRATTKLKLF